MTLNDNTRKLLNQVIFNSNFITFQKIPFAQMKAFTEQIEFDISKYQEQESEIEDNENDVSQSSIESGEEQSYESVDQENDEQNQSDYGDEDHSQPRTHPMNQMNLISNEN